MTDTRFTPEEFARLLALPPGHPDRRAVEADPRFDAWCRMLRAFESRDAHGLSAGEFREADAALERRLARELGTAEDARRTVLEEEAPGRPVRRAPAPRPERRAPWAWFLPSWAPAAALATAVVVAGAVWIQSTRESGHRVVRGGDPGRTSLEVSVTKAGGGRLTWSAVAGADEYRVIFFGPDLRERARIEMLTVPELDLRSLPAGLEAGEEVAVQVTALRSGAVLAESRTTTVRLP